MIDKETQPENWRSGYFEGREYSPSKMAYGPRNTVARWYRWELQSSYSPLRYWLIETANC